MAKTTIRIEGDVAYVPLSKGYEAIIDAKDAKLVSWWSWYANEKPRTVYAVAKIPKSSGSSVLKMHRLLTNAPEGMDVDHINGNDLDNRRSNLRVVTRAENRANSKGRRDSASGLKGTTFIKAKNRWRATITVRGVLHHLGSGFKTAQEAHEAYLAAAKRLNGDFAPTTGSTGVE